MIVWGRVSKAGAKIIHPQNDGESYLRFFIMSPYRLRSSSYVSVNWRNWDWEPKPGDFVRCCGLFELTEGYNGRNYLNLYINGNVPMKSELDVVPGVIMQKAPNWSAYPGYKGKEKKSKALDSHDT